ncbi:MAG TPA: hypothetical protein VJB59_08785 [Bdellovibrionota bacterium]|nr:hypothetical protein [Bdellovibrionota bacterium]
MNRSLIFVCGLMLLGVTRAIPLLASSGSCLNTSNTNPVFEQLRERIKYRQSLFSAEELTWDFWSKMQELPAMIPYSFSPEELSCMGFEVKFKNVHKSLQAEVISQIMPAFLLLDESMYPAGLRDKENRPEYFKSTIGRRVKIVGQLRDEASGGQYNPLTNTISIPLRAFRFSGYSAWRIQILCFRENQPDEFCAAINPWTDWQCGSSPVEGLFGIVLHEYGHNVDHALRGMLGTKGVFSSATKKWKMLHQEEFISPYGDLNSIEDFAESFTAYFLDPLMKCYAPKKFAWMSQIVRANPEIYGTAIPFEDYRCDQPRVQILLEERAKQVKTTREKCAN